MRIATVQDAYNERSGYYDPHFAKYWIVLDLPFDGRPQDVESLDLPIPNVAPNPTRVAAMNEYFPGFADIDQINFTFYEGINLHSLAYILGWKKKQFDPQTRAYGVPYDYKRDVNIALTNGGDRSQDSSIILRAKLRGLMPANTSPITCNMGADMTKVVQTFSVDGIEFSVNGVTY